MMHNFDNYYSDDINIIIMIKYWHHKFVIIFELHTVIIHNFVIINFTTIIVKSPFFNHDTELRQHMTINVQLVIINN